MTTRTHYDVLGIDTGADPATVRGAYHRLARQNHPDRVALSSASGEAMPAINEAYRVLSDPGRRAIYDASLRRARGDDRQPARDDVSAPGRDAGPGDEAMREWRYQHPEGPARIPWRMLSVCAAAAIIGILVLAQFTEPGEPTAPDGILRAGDCVEILANNDAGEIACGNPDGDLVVRQFVPFDRECSSGWTPYRDRQGMGKACIESVIPSGG